MNYSNHSSQLMARSHWAFLAFAMYSRWKLTSIRRCSGGITEPSGNNLNSWGSISRCPKFSMLALTFFANYWRCFVGRSARRILGDDQQLIAEYSPNNHRTFADIFLSEMHPRTSAKYLRSIGDYSLIVSSFATSWNTFAIILAHRRPTYIPALGNAGF